MEKLKPPQDPPHTAPNPPTRAFFLPASLWLAMISSLAKKMRASSSIRRNLCTQKGINFGTCKISSKSGSLQRFSLFGAIGLTSLFFFQQKNEVEAQDDRKVQQEKIIDAVLNKICVPWKSPIDDANWIQRRELELKLSTASDPKVYTILVGEQGTGKSSLLSHISEGKRGNIFLSSQLKFNNPSSVSQGFRKYGFG
jgi:hypothetical protein